ncbi:MAG: hypothetical protein ACE5IW_05710 [bacterium]
MNNNEKCQDPYSNKEFWIRQLNTKSPSELEACLLEFDNFAAEIEKEFRFVMSPSRAEVCRKALVELLRSETKRTKNSNQGELFNLS